MASRRAVLESAWKNRINCFLCLWNKLLLVRYLHLKKVVSEGSYSHHHVHLGRVFWKWDKLSKHRTQLAACLLVEVSILVMNDASMLNKPSTFWRKCPDSQNVFKKSININWEKRDLASTKPVVQIMTGKQKWKCIQMLLAIYGIGTLIHVFMMIFVLCLY